MCICQGQEDKTKTPENGRFYDGVGGVSFAKAAEDLLNNR
ncbi:MAG: hypothetical protein UV40_C0037G0009 [Parcubacteria group bacterium GW2011_GWA1_42_7]|nr:MAG: hypothetical protein UV34_C0006G0021 [Parcubacteria group bacterium GW2011_GWB1_42_6]KKS68997.1 MAG: hypothetical protein UV40_C0037G0009 [Parcubacteria group bacterium GW2011_GWA1_42_7]KKS92355.1 MAG: hypothetical protein UV67_C0005G0018 [Parcubacteria group bacterium GW2011_GWC1_43_12]